MNPDEIISILKEEIKNYDEISKDQEVGTVISVGAPEYFSMCAADFGSRTFSVDFSYADKRCFVGIRRSARASCGV